MKRALLIVALLCATQSNAQMNTGMDHAVASGGSFTGPGDVISGATLFWGLRAYNAAYANSHSKLANVCTPADASCQDVPSDSSGNFNLGATSLTCNNSGSICTVKTLYDQSGASSCSGPCDITQATIANRPILVVPGAANGCPTTSKYCMSTTGGGNQELVAIAGLASAVPQAFTVSAVYNNPSRTGDEYLLGSNFTVPLMISGSGGANNITINAGTNGGTTATDNVYHAVQGVYNNSAPIINVDGSDNSIGAIGTNGTFSSTFVFLNFQSGSGNSFGGFSQEMGLWPIGFTTTNSSNMSSNQHSYWGF